MTTAHCIHSLAILNGLGQGHRRSSCDRLDQEHDLVPALSEQGEGARFGIPLHGRRWRIPDSVQWHACRECAEDDGSPKGVRSRWCLYEAQLGWVQTWCLEGRGVRRTVRCRTWEYEREDIAVLLWTWRPKASTITGGTLKY